MDKLDDFQAQIVALVRAFGWHRPMTTPCGQPVSIAEAHAMLELSHSPQLTQKALAARLNLAKSTVSRLIGKLEQRQWIEKQRSLTDGRAFEVSLTSKGQLKAKEMAQARQQKLDGIWGQLSAEKQARLSHALQDLTEAIYASE